jgi:hypothetical protein
MARSARSASKWHDVSWRSIRRPACPPALPYLPPTGPECGPEVAREFFLAAHGREPVDARELAGQIAKDSRCGHRRLLDMT